MKKGFRFFAMMVLAFAAVSCSKGTQPWAGSLAEYASYEVFVPETQFQKSKITSATVVWDDGRQDVDAAFANINNVQGDMVADWRVTGDAWKGVLVKVDMNGDGVIETAITDQRGAVYKGIPMSYDEFIEHCEGSYSSERVSVGGVVGYKFVMYVSNYPVAYTGYASSGAISGQGYFASIQ